ncbi:MAG: sulfite exporter TauE/SafE family protein, partial [Promethearchaeota archaeon]
YSPQELILVKKDIKSNLKKGIPLFFLAGFIAYLSGIGGGMLFVPILNVGFGIPIHNATAISTAIIFFVAIYNTIVRMIIGHIYYYIGMIIAIGAVIGALSGAMISKKIPKLHLQFFVAFVLIALAIRLYVI